MPDVLGVLPNHLWSQAIDFTPTEFTLDRVEINLCAIFGRQSKCEIMVLDGGRPINNVQAGHVKPKRSALGKRKATAPLGPDMHYNLGCMNCQYCARVGNDTNNIGPHKVADCLEFGVFRRNIYAVGKSWLRKPLHLPVVEMKGKTNKVRGEIPVPECPHAAVSVDACRAVEYKAHVRPDEYVSPPPSALELPVTPGRSTAAFDGEDELRDSVVNAVDVDAKDKSQDGPQQSDDKEVMEEKAAEVNNRGIVATTEHFAGMMSELESKVTRYVKKKPSTRYMFTFDLGSKHSNTHISTIKLYLRGPKGIRLFLLDNTAMVPHATSNILSEFGLRRSGYQIIGSLSGKFKFVLFDNELVFNAKALNGAYYVQNKTQ
ncbi:Hypothetical protein PHPALM_20015 [Phytophthora palmivora]|uniref:Polyprotein n=1 Tax=Phytophthora palmivora TaxID=4796 RepID=A0A2P4XFX8_9STRA|nr:Hypothetical protein PHPALM_20015 [Phytophthora palmivora]